MADGENFGERMAVVRRERGISGGRKPIAEKYKPAIEKAERIFASAMPSEAERYIEELAPKEPEECPVHHTVLRCPECGHTSERTAYDHKAAAYLFDRIMGKPTARTENTLPVQFVQQFTINVIAVFREVNGIDDPIARQTAFAERILGLGESVAGDHA